MIYPKGYYGQLLSDLKDIIKYHGYQMSDIMGLVPFEYQVLKMLLVRDMQEAIESRQKS